MPILCGPLRRLRLCGGTLLLLLSSGCTPNGPQGPGAGVSLELAQERSAALDNLRYAVSFVVPAEQSRAIDGRQRVQFDLDKGALERPLTLDFNAGDRAAISALRANGSESPGVLRDGHVLIPLEALRDGSNTIEIDFTAGEQPLNRHAEYLYSLFVPDRASRAFPCFDQPDLKASFELTLEVPPDWSAVSNAPVVSSELAGTRKRIRFAPTKPLPTYLFAFAAGRFEVVEGESRGRFFRFFHRETEEEKVTRNSDQLFELHAGALEWLEQYTAIAYPFEKFDFVLLPDFQFGGMEHPGAVFYRASSLLLDASPRQQQLLGRASLIAHETAHMWFGDLVTMRWFNDVWTKEVFANFMAAKIVNPVFPELDHDVRFYLSHYPRAYEIDRSAGTHAIRQPLDNLARAASLYGAIIYQKAPIVMNHLERILGPEKMREGLREYLSRHRFANATWPDLIEILDRRSETDLAAWSRIWVEDAGRPTVFVERTSGRSISVNQEDPQLRARLWPQAIQLFIPGSATASRVEVFLDRRNLAVDGVAVDGAALVLPGADGAAYGRFRLSQQERDYLLQNVADLTGPVERAVAWEILWDALLEHEIEANDFLEALLASIAREAVILNLNRQLDHLENVYWGFFDSALRRSRVSALEESLWSLLESRKEPGERSQIFITLRRVALTSSSLDRVEAIWQAAEWDGWKLSEDDQTDTALELALKRPAEYERLISVQRARIESPFRKQRFDFVAQALSPDRATRRDFFEGLRNPQRRVHEPWVIEALSYLHHPLRAAESERFILPALMMLEEIERTGDIFFPKRWLDATLGGYRSQAAAAIVRDFLEQNPDYPQRLRLKILQSADLLYRRSHTNR